MAGRTYQDFDLVLEELGDASYRARVTSLAHGDLPSARFSMPYDDRDLQLLLLKLDPGRSGTRRAVGSLHTEAAKQFGGALFEAVFAGDVLLAWHQFQQSAREGGYGVRLRLRLRDAPSIAGLPWELLYDRRTDDFLAQSERTPIIRYLDTGTPPRPIKVSGRLHILAVICSPYDLPELDVDLEWRSLNDAMQQRIDEGRIRLDRLEQPTLASLGHWLRNNDVHILHFIGHGDFDPRLEDGVLYLSDAYGRRAAVTPAILGPFLRDHDALRLVLLNACQTARGDVRDAFSGMAQGLIQKQVDAVVAMQFPITDRAASAFAAEFYGAIGDGLPVDQAATSARKAMMQDYGDEWSTPVLFMRSKDGEIFTGMARDPESISARPASTQPPSSTTDHTTAGRTRPSPTQGLPSSAAASPSQAPAWVASPTPRRRTQSATIPAPGRAKPKPNVRVRHRRPIMGALVAVMIAGAVTALVLGLPRDSGGGTPDPRPLPTTPTMTTTEVSVPGSQLWTVTPVMCLAGQPLFIRATGTVQHGPTTDRTSGPDGMNGEFLSTNVVDDANHASLIGRIGEAGVPFNVGSGLDTKCPANGAVYLGINDEGYVGNIGQFHAAIEHQLG